MKLFFLVLFALGIIMLALQLADLLGVLRIEHFPSGRVSGISIRWYRYSTYFSRVIGYEEFAPRPIWYAPAAKWWYRGAVSFWWGRLHWETRIA